MNLIITTKNTTQLNINEALELCDAINIAKENNGNTKIILRDLDVDFYITALVTLIDEVTTRTVNHADIKARITFKDDNIHANLTGV